LQYGPQGLVKLYEENIITLNAIGVPFTVWSNAGLPEIRNGEVLYTITPEEFAAVSARFADLGISVIGGCCGTTPEHIAALTRRLGGYQGAPGSMNAGSVFSRAGFSTWTCRSDQGCC
jgi:homocysteine S-methyltransferase